MKIRIKNKKLKLLYFDCETVAAGFADPDWVPQRITCISWSWEGQDKVHSALRRNGAEEMLTKFVEAFNEADIVVAHNIKRFDLKVLNADLMRMKAEGKNVPLLTPKLVIDTMDLPKAKGFKKGLDDIATLLDLPTEKLSLNHRQWEMAYGWDKIIEGKAVTRRDWDVVKKRCESDVILLKMVRQKLMELGFLGPAKRWTPYGR